MEHSSLLYMQNMDDRLEQAMHAANNIVMKFLFRGPRIRLVFLRATDASIAEGPLGREANSCLWGF